MFDGWMDDCQVVRWMGECLIDGWMMVSWMGGCLMDGWMNGQVVTFVGWMYG